MPLISICVPTLKARRFVEPRIKSIMAQTVTDWELIVCDSHSDDGTLEFLRKFTGDARIHLHQVPREGVYAGWNECLRRATGEYVYIATADDTCEPTLLEKMITALEKTNVQHPTSNIQRSTKERDEGGNLKSERSEKSFTAEAARPEGARPRQGRAEEGAEKPMTTEARRRQEKSFTKGNEDNEERAREKRLLEFGAAERCPNSSSGCSPEEDRREAKDEGGRLKDGRESENATSTRPASGMAPYSGESPISSLQFPVSYSPARPLDIAVCDYRVIDEQGRTLDLDLNKNPRRFYGEWMSRPHIRDGRTEFLIHACLGIVWVTMTAVLFRRSLLDRIGLFPTNRGVAGDQEWQMRACLASDIAYVPEKLATWRRHDAQASAHTRKQYYDRDILLSLECVVDDPGSGIPEQWKEVPGWREAIMSVQRSLYHDSFNLFGNAARQDPRRFLRNVIRALSDEPGLLLRQAFHGFKWAKEFSVDGFETLPRLMRQFGCDWPPEARGLERKGNGALG